MKRTVLAFDIGASSGRAILGTLENGRIKLNEIHRFPNDPVCVNGTLYWDILRIFSEIKQGIKRAEDICGAEEGARIDAMAIDTWGVDFGILNKYGKLIENPVHYRDKRTCGISDELEKRASKEYIYSKTGIQFMFSNTLYQIIGAQKQNPHFFDGAGKLLMIPDLIINFLTGDIGCEMTAASTTQLYDPIKKNWSFDIMERFGIPADIFPRIVQPGSYRGRIRKEICDEMNIYPIDVYTAAEHDTASAVAAVPFAYKNILRKDMSAAVDPCSACISCGTASIIGVECTEPYIAGKAFEYNFTNEVGYAGTVRLMKNIMGMWLLNESRRWWQKKIRMYSFEELSALAEKAKPFQSIIDPDDDIFIAPGNLPGRIAEYCSTTNQHVPQDVGEFVRCIYESLALKHAFRLEMLSEITGNKYKTLHIAGGGSKNELFCKMIASACGCRVEAGPSEASVMGNCIVQFIALGDVKDLKEAREIVKNSIDIKVYEPVNSEEWKEFAHNKSYLYT